MHRATAILACVALTVLSAGAQARVLYDFAAPVRAGDDFDTFPFPPSRSALDLSIRSFNGTAPKTGRSYVGHVAYVPDPRYFAVAPPLYGCNATHVNTSVTASALGCVYATNAGFFSNGHPFCIGDLVCNGSVAQLDDGGRAHFGIRKAGNVVTGMLSAETVGDGSGFSQLIQGAGWLVRSGESYVNRSSDLSVTSSFVLEKAPRTAVGVMADLSTLILLQVDGVEVTDEGLDLFEFADVLVQLGAHSAVNLDGGGSSVSVYRGQVISRPTCIDIDLVCERPVSSITCVFDHPVN